MGIIKKRTVLTREQERALFEIVKSEKSTQAQKDKAVETLVLKNMGLVMKEARRYATSAVPVEDLIQEGAVGLFRAIQKFDLSMDKKFSTYATWWVKRDVGRIVRTSSDVIHVPEHTSEAARIAKAAIAKFENDNGRAPTDEEFEKATGMKKSKADEAIRAVQRTASLHAPVGDDSATELGDLIEDQKTESAEDEVARAEGRALIAKALRALSPDERTALALRYGVLAAPLTPKGVASLFGVDPAFMEREAERLGLAGEKARPSRAQ